MQALSPALTPNRVQQLEAALLSQCGTPLEPEPLSTETVTTISQLARQTLQNAVSLVPIGATPFTQDSEVGGG